MASATLIASSSRQGSTVSAKASTRSASRARVAAPRSLAPRSFERRIRRSLIRRMFLGTFSYSAPVRLGVLAVLGVLLLAGCSPAPSLRYEVRVSDATPRTVSVAAVLAGVSRGSIVLSGFAPERSLRLSDLSAVDARGRALAVRSWQDSATFGGTKPTGPRFVIAGPFQAPVTVRWRIDPNVREGDAHVGYAGVRAGYLGSDFALVSGRGLFLVPEPTSSLRDVRVRFI